MSDDAARIHSPRGGKPPDMSGEKNVHHVKQGNDRPVDDVDWEDREAKNEATWRGPGEEPRDVHQAGGGTVGMDLGGSHTGRRGAAPAKVESNRVRKPRGDDEPDA